MRLRLHYDKKRAVTNLVFLDGSQLEQDAIGALLHQPFRPHSEPLAEVLEALMEKVSTHGFRLIEGGESSYRLQLTLALGDEACEAQVDSDKEGMISSIRILKASSESVIQRIEKALVVPS